MKINYSPWIILFIYLTRATHKLKYLQNELLTILHSSFQAAMNILVSNLSTHIIVSDLVQLFSVYGKVSYAAIVRDKTSGRSKGTAFLEMPSEAEGEQAILALHQCLLDGKQIIVQEIGYKPGEFNN